MVDLDLLLLDAGDELGLLAEEEVQVGGLLAEGVVVALDEVPGNLLLGHVGVLGRVLLRGGRDGLRDGLRDRGTGDVVGAIETVGRTRDVLGGHVDLTSQYVEMGSRRDGRKREGQQAGLPVVLRLADGWTKREPKAFWSNDDEEEWWRADMGRLKGRSTGAESEGDFVRGRVWGGADGKDGSEEMLVGERRSAGTGWSGEKWREKKDVDGVFARRRPCFCFRGTAARK
jgi:hypothetical protein